MHLIIDKIFNQLLGSDAGKLSEMRKVFYGAHWLFWDRVLRVFLFFGVMLMIGRYLGPADFGIFSFVVSFVALFLPFSDLGLQEVLSKHLVQDRINASSWLASSIFMRFSGGCFAVVLSSVLAYVFWRESDYFILVLIVSLGYIFKASECIGYYFQSIVEAKYLAASRIIASIVFATFSMLVVFFEGSLVLFCYALSAEALIVGLVLIYFLYKKTNITLCLKDIDLYKIKELFFCSLPVMLAAVSIVLYMKIDQVMIKDMLGVSFVGIYSAAVNISEAFYCIPVVVGAVIFPALIASKEQSGEFYERRLIKLYKFMFWLAFLISFLVMAFSRNIVSILWGDKFIDASGVLMIHVWACIFVFWGSIGTRWLVIENLQKYCFYNAFLGAVLNVVLNFIMIPTMGLVGAAMSTVFSYAFASFFVEFIFSDTRKSFCFKLRSIVG